MPSVIIIAGPNGAGKSTFAPDLLNKHFSGIPFLNADSIAESLVSAGNVDIEAGRIMLTRMREFGRKRESFAFETTLSARTYVRFLKDVQKNGFSLQIAYLWLPDVELSVQRVAERVRVGGHDIPVPTIRRRFDRGRENFLNMYMPIADAWRLYNASEDIPILIASGDKLDGIKIVDEELWWTINNSKRSL
ncbi:MAG: zeta toxin family protein [Pyrinomonadaceae bacterium]